MGRTLGNKPRHHPSCSIQNEATPGATRCMRSTTNQPDTTSQNDSIKRNRSHPLHSHLLHSLATHSTHSRPRIYKRFVQNLGRTTLSLSHPKIEVLRASPIPPNGHSESKRKYQKQNKESEGRVGRGRACGRGTARYCDDLARQVFPFYRPLIRVYRSWVTQAPPLTLSARMPALK